MHLESIGLPIVKDRHYHGRRKLELPAGAPSLERHALHALRLAFVHPGTGERAEFEAPLAPELQALLDFLRERA